MKPQGRRNGALTQIAAVVMAAAASSEPPVCGNWVTLPGGTVVCPRHINGCPEQPRRHDTDCHPAAGPDHEGDCQAAQHTYVAQGEPGVFSHAIQYRAGEDEAVFRMVDVVGANGRRLLVRDDPDGAYIGGCLIADPHDLDDLIAKLDEISVRLHARQNGDGDA